MSFLEYPLTRPLTWLGRWGSWAFWIIGFLFVFLITLLNVITVGYEPVQVVVPSNDVPPKLWYEALPGIGNWLPASLTCSPTELTYNQGTFVHRMANNSKWFIPQTSCLRINWSGLSKVQPNRHCSAMRATPLTVRQWKWVSTSVAHRLRRYRHFSPAKS
jgi:hypothetical protein